MARRRVNTTKYEILRCAAALFIQKGYTDTSPKRICDELGISTGNLTYYFPTKEHLLAELVELLCKFQWELIQKEMDDHIDHITAIALELTTIAAAAEENPVAKDFFLAAYRSPRCLAIIQKNDRDRAKQVFAEYTADWPDARFDEAEMLVSGIEYATLMTAAEFAPTELRIRGAIDCILNIYCVPADIRRGIIDKMLAMDYRAMGRRVFGQFKHFVIESHEHVLEDMVRQRYGG